MTISSTPLDVPADALEAKQLAAPSAVPLDGPIEVRSRVDFVTEDRRVITGIWESDLGRSRWTFDTRGEIIHVIAGAMTVTEDGGEPVDLVAGSSAVFPIGWHGEWNVTVPIRKVYVVYKA
ncbi:MAG: transcriptional regulator [Glaciihabitans sp.]|nr:transcriptional regulator [Glaciihabitans sp.]